ncbi:P-loop containing nucleoside triphosphate hydrolase protein [Schizopora paradoxa]|uniref:DNA 3'-5' helicase n=1 Tax=Schizopora paradoxa TaxID=27342 RepID=A0A0H2SC58_9AGAM|nr:P-loop containing nucleoside triphosphate hydrolase protein [Schizopora paradoxa]
MSAQHTIHEKVKQRSYLNLENARKSANKGRYDSDGTRSRIVREVKRRMDGKEPFGWQLDVGEALHLKLDTVMIAGTGSGKTLPFAIPPILGGKVLVISPLLSLQYNQVERFTKEGFKAVAVNGETWSPKLAQRLKAGHDQIIVTSPEMCFTHEPFREILSSSDFSKDIVAIIIDECHVVEAWGEKFRTYYKAVGDLRAFFPIGTPILATTATLTPSSQQKLAKTLDIDLDKAFYLNLGNDRPNITYSVKVVKSAEDVEALKDFFAGPYDSREKIEQTVVFVDDRILAQVVCREIRSWLPPELHDTVCFFHAGRTKGSKRRVMKKIQTGYYRIMIATDAAGMGMDIPGITRVIQLGVTNSLSTWLQRAGRAGRKENSQAQAVLLVEASVFQLVNPPKEKPNNKKGKKKKKGAEVNGTSETDVAQASSTVENSGDLEQVGDEEVERPRTAMIEEDDHVVEDTNNSGSGIGETEGGGEVQNAASASVAANETEGLVPKKIIEPALREWIETRTCRRDKADEYFGNPPRTKQPTGACCDNCLARQRRTLPINLTDTPAAHFSPSNRVHGTPATTPNANNKRPMALPVNGLVEELPKQRRNSVPESRTLHWLKGARTKLMDLRQSLKKRLYARSCLSAEALIPDTVLAKLATKARLRTIDDIRAEIGETWALMEKHGEEALAVLRELDEKRLEDKAATNAANRELAKQKRAAEKAERLRLEAEEREKQRAEAKRKQEEVEARRAALQKEVDRRVQEQTDALRRATIAHPIPRSPPLFGSSMHNQSMQAPMVQTNLPYALRSANNYLSGQMSYVNASSLYQTERQNIAPPPPPTPVDNRGHSRPGNG